MSARVVVAVVLACAGLVCVVLGLVLAWLDRRRP